MGSIAPKRAWVTLLTRASYLAGTILLAHSLSEQDSTYPLLVLYTPSSLPSSLVAALRKEASRSNALLQAIEPLHPITKDEMTLIASRFEDTWTKLRVFELHEQGNMDEVFDLPLPLSVVEGKPGKGILANHACVCNLDGDGWAPSDWRRENCAFTPCVHPEALTHPPKVPSVDDKEGKRTHRLLNSGLFVFEPNKSMWQDMLQFIKDEHELLKKMQFPDQDFLAEFFKARWRSVGWQYNALKTWRYWHTEMWRDDEVRNVHYIVDKPWSERVGNDGVAGYRGRDGATHRWWWKEFERWEGQRRAEGHHEILDLMSQHVARPLQHVQSPDRLHAKSDGQSR
ncbi:hypothetical protein BP6252_01508 [Coleophoma cylindrospora]|uniref:Uncharacterized protein n=1 Tax=Coleophoma cylindrospora TaxID=1849047 RepID=A0A3D8ST44_9HELO|nr:hypothetical protein BP6252_01508 [Coleophoma cylindrospora]